MKPLPHHYHVRLAGGPAGHARLSMTGAPDLPAAPPLDFDGPGDAWSPEHLLLAAVESCFLFTLRAVPPRSPMVGPSKAATIRLGEQIWRRRQEQHLTRKQLATRAHTSHAYRQDRAKIERGGRLASRALLARIARVLRCSATELVADWAGRGGQRRADGIKSGAGPRHENRAD